MSLLDVEDRVDDVPKFTTSMMVEQYLNDIGERNLKLPFKFLGRPAIINNYIGTEDAYNDNDVLVRDVSASSFYFDTYIFINPSITNNYMFLDFFNNAVEIKEQVFPGIYKRVTYGWIKKHFNLE